MIWPFKDDVHAVETDTRNQPQHVRKVYMLVPAPPVNPPWLNNELVQDFERKQYMTQVSYVLTTKRTLTKRTNAIQNFRMMRDVMIHGPEWQVTRCQWRTINDDRWDIFESKIGRFCSSGRSDCANWPPTRSTPLGSMNGRKHAYDRGRFLPCFKSAIILAIVFCCEALTTNNNDSLISALLRKELT